jgi:hypothetical protein
LDGSGHEGEDTLPDVSNHFDDHNSVNSDESIQSNEEEEVFNNEEANLLEEKILKSRTMVQK